MDTGPLKLPRSARVILMDSDDRVLLIRFAANRAAGAVSFWARPGGTVVAGETDRIAACRELQEELGLQILIIGSVHTVETSFEYNAEVVANTDIFFVGRCDHDAPSLSAPTPEERLAVKEMQWCSIEEIETSTETIFPPDLAALVRRQR